MIDVEVPPRYEAGVFIGLDPSSQAVYAHGMDSFGARFSVPHGQGEVSDSAVEFVVPYPTGAFRDRFVHDRDSDTWTLEITACQDDGSWKHFAKYLLRRSGPSADHSV